jgi:hypothetical protein
MVIARGSFHLPTVPDIDGSVTQIVTILTIQRP